jgi:protein gp37
MAENSAITWTHHTFNPWWGCFKISPGCTHCYADAFDHRLGGRHWGKDAERKFFGEKHWNEPRKWAKRAAAAGVRERVFCASMADVFEDRRDLDAERAKLWPLIRETPSLDWLLLTKRPDAIDRLFPVDVPPNIWLGTTVEDADYAWRVADLVRIPALVHFVSWEPALSPIAQLIPRWTGIDWLVCGDESGRVRRPAEVDWFRAARDACERQGIAFHMKQWAGADVPGIEGVRKGGKIHLPVLDGRVHGAFPDLALPTTPKEQP